MTVDQTRQKVLEAVAQGTMGLREENRELRRRQERMLTDLAEARSGLEALSRRLEESIQAVPLVSPDVASPLVAGAPATTESDLQPPAGPDPAEPEVLGEPAELTERSDGKEPRVLEEVRNAHGHGNTAGKPETAPHLTPVAEPVQEPAQADQRAHLQCLLSAAAIASATLVCHRETWDFIAEHTSGHTHFRLPEQIDDADGGRIEASLSGRSLLAVLTTMWKVTREHEGGSTSSGDGDQDLATWALAAAVYRRTALAVDRVTHLAEKENGPALIVLDDRSARTTAPEGAAAA
ncbi:hypothetical protein ACFYP6_27175 [Streptomyces goshikiensis]|uniref:hypothetical protein n=1 Tax=Streptomyces goshikiensis TaxID=1942 RepID=UPI0036C2AEBE